MRRLVALLVLSIPIVLPAPAQATTLPPGFRETAVLSGLNNPTVVRFAPDGRVFVALKGGEVEQFDNLEDPAPTVLADLRPEVDDYWDRGLLGMALDPGFTTGRPYVYVLYAYDKDPNTATVPRWNDDCPTPPGPTTNGCTVTTRLARIDPAGQETVLIDDWCQQFPSHSAGTLEFGPDGMLYASGGEGASFNFADYGQVGNPCRDPAGGGGSLRAQSPNRPAGQPAVLSGSLIRVDPDTGAAAPGNPAGANPDPNRRRIVAFGFRNPFRFTFRPGTSELWVGDVGWNSWEEINRVPDLAGARDYGWPCYEGAAKHPAWDALNKGVCEALYTAGTTAAPYYTYRHADKVVAGESCPSGSASLSGLAFNAGTEFPDAYRDALFFSDYSRNCIWVMPAGANGLPDPSSVKTFAANAAGPVNLLQGPDGALYYPDIAGGTVRRIHYDNQAPVARIDATPPSGTAPLTVAFNAGGSTDRDGQPLTYAWDLDGDGVFDDSTDVDPTRTYTARGVVTVAVRVTDAAGGTGRATTKITVGTPPAVTIAAPGAETQWAVGNVVSFSGGALDFTGAALPAGRLRWSLDLLHCAPTDERQCHTHRVQDFKGVASGSFVAPDHEYPSHLELSLTATDADGVSATRTVRLDPRTIDVTVHSAPEGLQVAFGSETATTPFTRTVIAGSDSSLAASSPQALGGVSYRFAGWSDGQAVAHDFTAPESGNLSITAAFSPVTVAPSRPGAPLPGVPPASAAGPVGAWGFEEGSGPLARDGSGHGNTGRIAGARRVAGRLGGGLRFDGKDDWVTVPDSPSLRARSGLTVEAWVNPTAGGTLRTLAVKERSRGLAWGLYGGSVASGHVYTAGERWARRRLALRRWSHVAVTYDGARIRLYVNGALVARAAQKGVPAAGAGVLHLGGNRLWKEWLRGRLDELRVYARPLSAAEIATDMRTPVTTGGAAGAARGTGSGAGQVRYRASGPHRRG